MSIFSLFLRLLKYAPLIEAIFQAIEQGKSEAEVARAAAEFERGFRVLTETKDPKQLEDAIRAHCTPEHGCVLP